MDLTSSFAQPTASSSAQPPAGYSLSQHLGNISGRGAVYREFKYTEKYGISVIFYFFDVFRIFLIFYRVFRAREAFRNLPGARGVVFPKYQPVASHGDPFQTRNYLFWSTQNVYVSPDSTPFNKNFQKLQFYDVFLKVRLTKYRKGCTEFSEVAILRCVFEGETHQVL